MLCEAASRFLQTTVGKGLYKKPYLQWVHFQQFVVFKGFEVKVKFAHLKISFIFILLVLLVHVSCLQTSSIDPDR